MMSPRPPSTPPPRPSQPPAGPSSPRPPASPPGPGRSATLPALADAALALALTVGALGSDVIWLGLGHPVTSYAVLSELFVLFVLGQTVGPALARRATPH